MSEDIFLVNNLRSGLLDCFLKFTDNKDIAEHVQRHLDTLSDIGITINKDKPAPVSLKNFEITVEKLRLASLRKRCFEVLLKYVRQHSAMNKIGFDHGDEFYIQYALSNQTALEEYAQVHDISVDFARKELDLISQSAIRDNFRVFTVSSLLKNKINNTTKEEDVHDILELIKKSFTLYGILDV